jgi:hypothetical protein
VIQPLKLSIKIYRNLCDLSRGFMQIRIRPFSRIASETVYSQKS